MAKKSQGYSFETFSRQDIHLPKMGIGPNLGQRSLHKGLSQSKKFKKFILTTIY